MIASPSELEIIPSTHDSVKQTQRFRLEYSEFLGMAEKHQQWGEAHVVTICENLVDSRKALFGAEQILPSGLHQLEFAEIQKIALKIEYLSAPEKSLVWASVAFALKAHALQQRKSKAPYSVHICAVVQTLAERKMDAITLAAGALHDTVEDCTSVNDRAAFITLLRTVFGDSVVEPVSFITKIQDVRNQHETKGDEAAWINHLYASIGMQPKEGKNSIELVDELYRLQLVISLLLHRKTELENNPKLSNYELSALRALLVKLADRLHNMQTLGPMSYESQQKNATETREIYVRLAQKFGLWDIATELADLSAQYLAPDSEKPLLPLYQNLATELSQTTLPLAELEAFILPSSAERASVKTQLTVPAAAAMQAVKEPFVTLDIAVLDQLSGEQSTENTALAHIAESITNRLRVHFGHMKRFSFSELETVMDLIKSKTLNTYSFFIPTPVELHPAIKLLRVNITSEATLNQESASILPLVQSQATPELKQRATDKWLEIQAHGAEYQEKFSRLFKTFSSAELLLALTQRVPVGMMLVMGAPPAKKSGEPRPRLPWLVTQASTIADYIQSIASLRHKKIKSVTVNGMSAEDFTIPLLPFDEVTITAA